MRISLVMIAVALTACSTPDPSPPPLGLIGDWELVSGELDGLPFPMVDGYRITVSFEADGSFGGTAACNGYGGSYVADTEDVIIGDEMFSTAMACEGPVMESESAYLGVLRNPLTYERAGDALTIRSDNARLDFRTVQPITHSDLVGTEWVLTSWGVDDSVTTATGDPATLLLSENGTVDGSTGCRSLTGSYLIDADTVRFTSFSAGGACTVELTPQDDHVVNVLGDGFTTVIDGDVLTVRSPGNEFLIYRR